jgi:hypothetical protein
LPLSLALMFSLLRCLPLACFPFAHALMFVPLLDQALVLRAASADVFFGPLITARIAHLSVAFEKMFLSRGSQSDARAGRVTEPPQDIPLRALEGIWKIFGNALGKFSLDLQQAFLLGDRHLTERKPIGFIQFRSEFFSRLDCPKRTSSSCCALLGPPARFGCLCPGRRCLGEG